MNYFIGMYVCKYKLCIFLMFMLVGVNNCKLVYLCVEIGNLMRSPKQTKKLTIIKILIFCQIHCTCCLCFSEIFLSFFVRTSFSESSHVLSMHVGLCAFVYVLTIPLELQLPQGECKPSRSVFPPNRQ